MMPFSTLAPFAASSVTMPAATSASTPALTGGENLRFFGRLNHLSNALASQRIAHLAQQFHLEEALDRQVRTLSSGTVQRLSLARALLHEPRVLLLDEPTRSLDAIAASEFRRFLKSEVLRRGDTSLLFASHTLPEVEQLADRIAIIDAGRLLACDTLAALKRTTGAATLEDAFLRLTGRTPHLTRRGRPGMIRSLREVWIFFWRDLSIARTYRTLFVLEAIEALFGAAMFFYAARFVDSPQFQHALPQGGSYFAFSLVGFVFLDYLNAAMDTFDQSLAEARDSGTLEHLLVTQTSLPAILAGSAIYPFVVTTLRIAVYLAWGALLFGFPLRDANWPTVAAVLLATLLAFSGLGILSASYVLLFKRGNPGKWFLLGVSGVASGVLFPISVLPDWLQFVAV